MHFAEIAAYEFGLIFVPAMAFTYRSTSPMFPPQPFEWS